MTNRTTSLQVNNTDAAPHERQHPARTSADDSIPHNTAQTNIRAPKPGGTIRNTPQPSTARKGSSSTTTTSQNRAEEPHKPFPFLSSFLVRSPLNVFFLSFVFPFRQRMYEYIGVASLGIPSCLCFGGGEGGGREKSSSFGLIVVSLAAIKGDDKAKKTKRQKSRRAPRKKKSEWIHPIEKSTCGICPRSFEVSSAGLFSMRAAVSVRICLA